MKKKINEWHFGGQKTKPHSFKKEGAANSEAC